MDDEMLMALKQNGGVIQTVALFDVRQGRSAASAVRRSLRLRREFGLAAAARNREAGRLRGCPIEGAAAEPNSFGTESIWQPWRRSQPNVAPSTTVD